MSAFNRRDGGAGRSSTYQTTLTTHGPNNEPVVRDVAVRYSYDGTAVVVHSVVDEYGANIIRDPQVDVAALEEEILQYVVDNEPAIGYSTEAALADPHGGNHEGFELRAMKEIDSIVSTVVGEKSNRVALDPSVLAVLNRVRKLARMVITIHSDFEDPSVVVRPQMSRRHD